MTQVPGNQHAEDLRRACDALQEQVAKLTEKIGAGEGKNQMRTVDELTPEALARAIAAYEKAHNTKPDFGFAPDRAWMEGYSAHAASQDALDAARYRYLQSIAVQTADPLGPIFSITIRRIDQDGLWGNVSATIDAHIATKQEHKP